MYRITGAGLRMVESEMDFDGKGASCGPQYRKTGQH